jgi:hypothetical protein
MRLINKPRTVLHPVPSSLAHRCVGSILSLILSACWLYGQVSVDRRVDSLLALMTLDEKVGQLVQLSDPSPETKELIRQGRIGSFLNVVGVNETRKLQQIAVKESRLKIPLIFGLDVIHGFRTTFPIPLATACRLKELSALQQLKQQRLESTGHFHLWLISHEMRDGVVSLKVPVKIPIWVP